MSVVVVSDYLLAIKAVRSKANDHRGRGEAELLRLAFDAAAPIRLRAREYFQRAYGLSLPQEGDRISLRNGLLLSLAHALVEDAQTTIQASKDLIEHLHRNQ